MKSIHLMTYFTAQACLCEVENYISIRHVKPSNKRMNQVDDTVNFADFWFEMVESEKLLDGKYVGQHFCLMNDEDDEQKRKEFWEKQDGKDVVVCFIKNNAANKKSTISIAAKEIGKFLEKKEFVETKIFRTIDNADLILFLFGTTKEWLRMVVDELLGLTYKNHNVIHSFYGVSGKFRFVQDNNKEEYNICNVKIMKEHISGRTRWEEKSWCEKAIKEVKDKIDDSIKHKDRKWTSYYQILNQILNLLWQYDQEEKHKDLFYIFYPPMKLFLRQLEQGQKQIDYDTEEILKIKIEDTVSEFIESMELLIHHMGSSCTNILNFGGRNGLPYDISIKLCLFYLAVLHVAVKVLNNENYEYQFCLSPVAYSRPTTNVFDFGLEPGDRLIRVAVMRQNLYNVRAMMGILSHEASHYAGDYRMRKQRAGYYIASCAAILTEMLMPSEKMLEICDKFLLKEHERKALFESLRKTKQRIQLYFEQEMKDVAKSINEAKEEKAKYHFVQLNTAMKYVVREILFDRKHRLLWLINQVDEDLKQEFMFMQEKNNLFQAFEEAQTMFQNNWEEIVTGFEIGNRMDDLKNAFKEIYADLSSIILLGIEPKDYLFNYLLSEGFVPETRITNNILINRIAIVNKVMAQINEKWKEKWNKLNDEELNYNTYLIDLRKRVDCWTDSLETEGNTDSNGNISLGTIRDPFLVKEIVWQELEYAKECAKGLSKGIGKEEVKEPLLLLRELYAHFESDEKSFREFFDTFDKFLAYYKNDVRVEWKKSLDGNK